MRVGLIASPHDASTEALWRMAWRRRCSSRASLSAAPSVGMGKRSAIDRSPETRLNHQTLDRPPAPTLNARYSPSMHCPELVRLVSGDYPRKGDARIRP